MTATQALLVAAIFAFAPALVILRTRYPRTDATDEDSDWLDPTLPHDWRN